jgi:EpsI family protein
MSNFFKSRSARFVSLLMMLQIVVFYAFPKTEKVPLGRPLKEVPLDLGGWHMVQESQLETEVLELLKADDTLNRVYANPEKAAASLYIAFFKSQQGGVVPHSPRVCLPGNGWTPSTNDIIPITVPGEKGPIRVNRYVVSRGENRSVVLYWYQTAHRVIASEYAAKVYTVLDSARYRRSDTSLVRVVVPVESTLERADQLALNFVQSFFPTLRDYLPR